MVYRSGKVFNTAMRKTEGVGGLSDNYE